MGQLEDHEAIQNAVRDQDAVLITLGGYGILTMDTAASVGTRAIIAAMKKEGIKDSFTYETL